MEELFFRKLTFEDKLARHWKNEKGFYITLFVIFTCLFLNDMVSIHITWGH